MEKGEVRIYFGIGYLQNWLQNKIHITLAISSHASFLNGNLLLGRYRDIDKRDKKLIEFFP